MLIIQLLMTTILSYISVKLIIKYAQKLHLVDIPNERSHHCNITPRGAGIGFISSMILEGDDISV